MFKVTGKVEEVGDIEDENGFTSPGVLVIAPDDVRVRVTGLSPAYVRELGTFLYSNVTVLIDTTADSAP